MLAFEGFTSLTAGAEEFVVTNTDNYYVSLTSDALNGELHVFMTPSADGNMATLDNNLKIATDDPGGYRLLISTANNYNDLVKAGTADKITASAGTINSTQPLSNNTWGYAVDNTLAVPGNGFDTDYSAPSGTSKYAGIPSAVDAPTLVRQTTTANAGNAYDSMAVHYGVKIDYAIPIGTYANEVIYTAMTETSAQIGEYNGTDEPGAIEIDANMIPIKYTGTLDTPEWQKADITNVDNDWFSYSDKKWANAVTVSATTLSGYKAAPVGTVIAESDVLGYFVYIPRYRYKIQGQMTQDGTTQLGELTYVKRNQAPRNFEIQFQTPADPRYVNDKIETWLTQPAFTFGDCTSSTHCFGGSVELGGIWVGKFETTGSAANPTIKPGLSSFGGYPQVGLPYFTYAQVVGGVHGLTASTDTRMSKNSDWGAVAYLATSKYGKGASSMVWTNPVTTTGCAGTSQSASGGSCNSYFTNNGRQASTTGNVYGVYDMAGGMVELMATQYNAATVSKYYDNYTVNSFANCNTECLGGALYETAGWNGAATGFMSTTNVNSWFIRGGSGPYSYSEYASIFSSAEGRSISSCSGAGCPVYYTTFRIVMSAAD